MTREITHMKAFAAALESMAKPAFSIGRIAPTPGLVNQFFNDSTGSGDHGEIDTRGPWNEGRTGCSWSRPPFTTTLPTARRPLWPKARRLKPPTVWTSSSSMNCATSFTRRSN
jgi:Mn-containing catalase